MGVHPDFPSSPYAELVPDQRWFPADEMLRATSADRLIPPLVAAIRQEVFEWRHAGYKGASATSGALLRWWFDEEHQFETRDGSLETFRYYFAQREAVETIIWLHDVRKARDKFDLLRFTAAESLSPKMFAEQWPRYVVKMATGAGKTKVLSLLIAWSYFHKLYEPESTLSRNFLLIAPNIIVLDRLRADFDGRRIFFADPVLPSNGFEGQNWQDDFQVTVHIQDDVRAHPPTGNIFLTNIHRVYLGDAREPSLDDDDRRDYFLSPFGPKPVGRTTDSRVDLGEIVRDIDELAVFNDEAHHIHDERMAWFKSIQDIHHRMVQKDGSLALQVDVTATPRHDNGAIFVQTVSDYPLVEAIHQNVVKHPVLPDAASRARLKENTSAIFSEKYDDYLRLGIEEWKKSSAEHTLLGKKAVLFVMVDDTRNCDEVGAYLERICPDLQGAVLVIHTKKNGEISESASGKDKDELEGLRRQANEIDSLKSPYKAIVSVLMLKEGWDVRNVTVIVGLRAFVAEAKILPEQTLGRGLRRMYFGTDTRETVSLTGTPAFMEFVESIQAEGVTLETKPMGAGSSKQDSLVVEVEDNGAHGKDIEALDIEIPRLSRRYSREFKNLADLDPSALGEARVPLKPFSDEETREIVFKRMVDATIDHTIHLDGTGPADYRSVIAYFARQLLKELRLVGGYDILYPHVRDYIKTRLFEGPPVELENPQVLRNLSEPEPQKVLFDAFRKAINDLTIADAGTSRIEDPIRLRETRPFRMEHRPYLQAKKSVFNRIVPEAQGGGFELTFAAFLDGASDVASFAKNYLAIGFKLDYVKADGDLSNYIPDFFVRTTDGAVYVVETKGREEIDLPQKMTRLRDWCRDATTASRAIDGPEYRFVFVDEAGFTKHTPRDFAGVVKTFREFQE